jgi:competence protein ComEC
MRLFSFFFLLGTILVQFFSELPSLLWLTLLLSACITLVTFTRYKFKKTTNSVLTKKPAQIILPGIAISAFVAGLLIAVFSAQKQLNARLPAALEGQDIILQGRIQDIPEFRQTMDNQGNIADGGLRFRFNIKQAFELDGKRQLPLSGGIVRLGWYKDWKPVEAGEIWRLRVRLKRPSGFMNPGGFDYEKWLFSERIIATGYVRKAKNVALNQRISAAPWWSINHLREGIHKIIQTQVMDKPSAAILSALSIADRSNLDREQWQILQQTGTSHLVAISGLHIAIVAGFAFLPVFLLWRIFPRLNEMIPVPVAGGVLGIIFALFYAMLAGFTLPTQRALLMVMIALLGLISRRYYPASSILAIALVAVLLLDPLAAMTISFWLSFLAVGIILIILRRQMLIEKPRLHSLTLQIILSLGMFPLTLLFFGTGSLVAPLANIFAIPWVALIVVPLTLLGVLFIPLSRFFSDALFNIAALAVDWLFKGFEYLNSFDLLTVDLPAIPVVYLLLAFAGFLFFLLPKGFPGRWLAAFLVLPAVLFSPAKPDPGSFTYALLDVGQGMASVLRTKNHVLIYDVGKRLNDNFDVGRLVVVPYLKAKGVHKVDVLILSHEDNDHRGGAKAVLEALDIDRVQSSDLSILPKYMVDSCQEGQSWQWDGVNFEVLSPPGDWIKSIDPETTGTPIVSDNNLSCVLRVSNKHHSLLLTGDIEKRVEQQLVYRYPNLQTEVIIVPHHGSKTSSSKLFLAETQAKLALLPVGYRNRFGHPKDEVIQRYENAGIKVLDTVENGALELVFPTSSELQVDIKAWRKEHRGFWSR